MVRAHHNRKIKCSKYKTGSVCGGRNTIQFIAPENKIVIPQKLQKYEIQWYHMHPLCPVLNRTEVVFHKNLYWPSIKEAVKKEVKIVTADKVQMVNKKWYITG